MRADNETNWCILRTSSSRAMALVDELTKEGFEVWAPIDEIEKPRPRSTELRRITVAILGGFVFARYQHVADLLRLSRSPGMSHQVWDATLRRMVTRGLPYFSVVLRDGHASVVSDASLAGLRKVEAQLKVLAEQRRERARRRGPVPQFAVGQIVRLAGAFEGLDMVVEGMDRAMVRLAWPDSMLPAAQISAWKLEAVERVMHAA